LNHLELTKKAEKMAYKFLFYTEDYAQDFFRNLDKNIIMEEDTSIFFIEKTTDENSLFWAGATMEDVIRGLHNLKKALGEDTVVLIKCGEDKSTAGQLAVILPYFINNGGSIFYHNIGYKASSLSFQQDFPLVRAAETGHCNELLNLAYDLFGRNKFDMDIDELKSYITEEDKCLFLIKDKSSIAGLILGSIYNQGKTVFVRGLAVDKPYRGLGYSNQLLSKLFNWAKEKGVENSMLWVENSNTAAKALYKKFGFLPYGDQEATIKYTL
jgi:ribosomal protein S18 acetylase RimI-like enzyme